MAGKNGKIKGESSELRMNEFERYERQVRVLGEDAQARICESSVLVVGCGALGTHVAEMLVRAGVRHLVLVDDDVIELSNLQRQSLFEAQDVGRLKVEAARERLLAIDESCQITAVAVKFDKVDLDALGWPDVLVDGTDNFLARELINDVALEEKIPWVFAALAGTSGQVMALRPWVADLPCLACAFPELADLEANCETIGVVTPIVPIIAGLEAGLVLRLLIEQDSVKFDEMLVADWTGEIQHFHVNKRGSCAACGRDRGLSNLTKVCGGAFQGVTHRSVRFDKGWEVDEKRLACFVKFDKYEITVFHNGRVLFYGFESAPTEIWEWMNNENRHSDGI
ncbi:MAG: HesA/MoeB/ThiF family protein [Streptococcaceae bacterium]|nr:HesA/MoeB/ThiF family protein [Streptococcaceae bacterium]